MVVPLRPGLLPPAAAVEVGRVRAACVYSGQLVFKHILCV